MITRLYKTTNLSQTQPGLAFRVTFAKLNYQHKQELQGELQGELQYELQHELKSPSLYSQVLEIAKQKELSTTDISNVLGQKRISGQLRIVLAKLIKDKLLAWTIPEKPKSKNQQYKITDRGIAFLNY
jgi:ATP-dependent DNA helicase RecG